MDIERVLRQWREVITATLAKAGIVILGFDHVNNRTEFIGVDDSGNVQTEVTNTPTVDASGFTVPVDASGFTVPVDASGFTVPVDASGFQVPSGLARQVVPIAEQTVPDAGNVDVDIDTRALIMNGFYTLAIETSELTSGTGLDDVSVTIQSLVCDLKDSVVSTFDIDLVANDDVVVTINGVALANVPWNTDNDTMVDDVAAAILAHANVEAVVVSGTPPNNHVITVTAKSELDVVINSVVVTNTVAPGSEAVAVIVRTADVEVWTVPSNSTAITLETALDISTIGNTAQWSLNQAAAASLPEDNPLPGDGFRLNFANGAGGAGLIIGKVIVR